MPRLSASVSFLLGCLCRLAGLAAAVLLLRVCLSRGLMESTPLAVLQMGAALVLAILIGSVVKECAFAMSEAAVTACGKPFFRKSLTVTGKLVSEVWLPGGMWVRCETWRDGAALAWTERDGSCTGIELPAMQVARASPIAPPSPSRSQVQALMRRAAVVSARIQTQGVQAAAVGRFADLHAVPGNRYRGSERNPLF